ncbi:hypothetical protein HMPREF9163_02384 [Selenomonas sp. oral taxon 138 str. F0429]|nr:hypothetical protein HMPREF9163_02384 [Selenomonas sp. oral taxon 138 str. F0429]
MQKTTACAVVFCIMEYESLLSQNVDEKCIWIIRQQRLLMI